MLQHLQIVAGQASQGDAVNLIYRPGHLASIQALNATPLAGSQKHAPVLSKMHPHATKQGCWRLNKLAFAMSSPKGPRIQRNPRIVLHAQCAGEEKMPSPEAFSKSSQEGFV